VHAGCLPPPEKKFKGFRDLSGPKGQHRLVVTYGGEVKKVEPAEIAEFLKVEAKGRSRCLLVGPCVAGVTPFVSANNLYNACKAVLGRVFRKPAHEAQRSSWAVLRRFDDFLLNGLLSDVVHQQTEDEWILGCPARRIKAFLRAKILLHEKHWDDDWKWFSSFIKGEKLFGESQGEDRLEELEALMDRLIQAPNDCTHLIAGPLLRPLTKLLKKRWDRTSFIFYAAVSVEELNLWFNQHYRPGFVGVMCDYSMFDNSHSVYSWEWVESIYRRMGLFDMDDRFERVMDAWRTPCGRMTGMGWVLVYRAFIMNASGRDDTALANALLNGAVMFLCLVAALSDKCVEVLTLRDLLWGMENVALSVCGDDSLALISHLPCASDAFSVRLSGLLAGFGFDAGADKMKVSDNPFDMVYLAMRPHPFEGRWFFAKTIGRALWKLGWRMDYESGDQEAWMAGNMYQVVQSQAIVPVLSDIAEAYLFYHGNRTRRRCEPDPNRPWEWGTTTPPYNAEVLRYIADGYGVFVSELLDCINYLRRVDRFPCVIDHPVITRMVCYDEM
jgi:hypothetical protein